MINEEEAKLWYLAGIIDGEGTITIVKQKIEKRVGYSMRIQVGNTSEKLIDWLSENFWGGTSQHPLVKNRKRVLDWYIIAYPAYKLLLKIRDKLLIKQEQCEVCIEYWQRVARNNYGGRRQRPLWATHRAESLYQQIRGLNKTGYNKTQQVG